MQGKEELLEPGRPLVRRFANMLTFKRSLPSTGLPLQQGVVSCPGKSAGHGRCTLQVSWGKNQELLISPRQIGSCKLIIAEWWVRWPPRFFENSCCGISMRLWSNLEEMSVWKKGKRKVESGLGGIAVITLWKTNSSVSSHHLQLSDSGPFSHYQVLKNIK